MKSVVQAFQKQKTLFIKNKNKQLICFVRAIDLWEGWDLESNPNVKCIRIGRSKPWFNIESDLGKAVFYHIIENKKYYKEKIEEVKKQFS